MLTRMPCCPRVQDPTLVIDKYGADALRLYLINSPVVRADNLAFQVRLCLVSLPRGWFRSAFLCVDSLCSAGAAMHASQRAWAMGGRSNSCLACWPACSWVGVRA